MGTTELRIGNYIMDSPVNGDDVLDVQAIYTNLIIHEERHVYNDELRPIPLTEEWLLKFGFEDNNLKMSGSKWLEKSRKAIWRSGIRISKRQNDNEGEWSITLESVSPPTLAISFLKYVHQLQNLYFALTGEELQLK